MRLTGNCIHNPDEMYEEFEDTKGAMLMFVCGVHNQSQSGKNVYDSKVLNVNYIVAIMLKQSRPI
jgi:hypothetical protein